MGGTKLVSGIIGAGSIAQHHIRGYMQAGVEVKVIADLDVKRAKVLAEEYKIPNILSSYKNMLREFPEISLVSVCVPNKYHAQISIDCLDAGRNVFCEKPPALNMEETLMMKEAAEKGNRVLMFDFNNRARSETQAIMKYIKTGGIGRINSAQALWIRRCGIPAFGGWFSQKALSGGGPLIDLLHMIDLALYLMDFPEPEWVLAQTFHEFADDPDFKGPWGLPDLDGAHLDVETSCHAFIRFKSGQVIFARNSWAEMNKREEASVTFQGTKAGGMIRRLFGRDGIDETAIDDLEIYTIENGHPVNKRVIVERDEKMGREKAVVNFVKTVLKKDKPLSTPDEAVILMRIIDAIYKSAEKKRPQEVE